MDKHIILLIFSLSSITFIRPAPFDIIFCGLILFYFLRNKINFSSKFRLLYLYFFFFILSNIVSLFFVESNLRYSLSFSLVNLYVSIIPIFICSLCLSDEKNIHYIVRGFIISGHISATYGILQFFNIAPNLFHNRIVGFFKDPNFFSASLIFPSICFFNEYVTQKKKVYFAKFIFFALVIILSLSRGAIISLIFGIIINYIMLLKNKIIDKTQIFKTIISFIFALIPIFCIGSRVFEERNSFQIYDFERFENQREIFMQSLKMPFGHGPGQSNLFSGKIYTTNAPHSAFIRLIYENGIIGVLSFFFLFLYIVFRGFYAKINKSNSKYFIVSYSSLMAIFLEMMIIDIIHWIYFAIILGLFFATKELKEEN